MLNLIQADWFKLRKKRGLYLCLMIMIIMIIGTAFSYHYVLSLYGSMPDTMLKQFDQNLAHATADFSFSVSGNLPASTISDMLSELKIMDCITFAESICISNYLAFFLIIIGCLFTGSDFHAGLCHHAVARGFDRCTVYLSKYVTLIILAFLILIFTTFVAVLTGFISYGIAVVTPDAVVDFLYKLLLQFITLCGYAALITAICIHTRSTGVALAVNFGLFFLIPGLTSLLSSFTGISWFPILWIGETLVKSELNIISPTVFCQIVGISLIYIFVPTLWGMASFVKSDLL